MARDDRDRNCGMDDRVEKEVQTQLGVLALSREQCSLDYLGVA